MMRLAGIELTDDSLLALVTRLRRADLDNQADRIVDALMSMQTEVTLTHPDRVAITVLDDPPGGSRSCAPHWSPSTLLVQADDPRAGRGHRRADDLTAGSSGPGHEHVMS